MSHCLLKPSMLFLAVFLGGCATSPDEQARRRQLSFDYFDCVAEKSKSLDDGVSSMSDIAAGAILGCGKHENAAVRPYDAFLQEKARKGLRDSAYAVAARAISDNRKKASPRNQPVAGCNMSVLHESCYQIGYAKKAEGECSEIAGIARATSAKTISDKSTLMGIETLCYQWCVNGVLSKPKVGQEELCK